MPRRFLLLAVLSLFAACIDTEVDAYESESIAPSIPPRPPIPMPPHHEPPTPPDQPPIPLPPTCWQCHTPYPSPSPYPPRPGSPPPLPPNNRCTQCHLIPPPVPDPSDPHPNGPPPGIPRPLPPGDGPPYCSNCHPIAWPPMET